MIAKPENSEHANSRNKPVNSNLSCRTCQLGRSRKILRAISPATPFIQTWPRLSAFAIKASAQ